MPSEGPESSGAFFPHIQKTAGAKQRSGRDFSLQNALDQRFGVRLTVETSV